MTLQQVTLQLEPPSTRWEKKKADRNCVSSNPEDCLVWCLVEIPGKSIDIVEVIDTFSISEYERQLHSFYTFEKGGYTEWAEIICQENITSRLIENMQVALREDGYDLRANGSFNKATKAALKGYQEKHRLLLGGLTFEVLDHLGVEY